MLLKLPQFISWLQCPIDGSDLTIRENSVVPANERMKYISVRGKPVLVDFEKSLLDQQHFLSSQGESVVTRTKDAWWVRAYRALANPEPVLTTRNIDRLIALGRKQSARPRVLIVGGGTVGQGAEALYASPDVELVAFDIYESPHVQLIADAHDLPFKAGIFDAVVIQAVLEHVLQPDRVVEEIHRVLKDGGTAYAETPFMQQVHEGPYDFTRYTESGHRWLFRGFERVDSGVLNGPGMQMIWSLAYLARGVFRSRTAGRGVRLVFFWLRFFDHFIPQRFQVDGACGVFFLGIKGKPIVPKDMVRHYLGAG